MTRSENKPSIAAVKEFMGANHDMLRKIVQDLLQEMLEGEMTDGQWWLSTASGEAIGNAAAELRTIIRNLNAEPIEGETPA